MLRSQPKTGFKRQDLVVASDEVDLTGEAYQSLKAVERTWKLIDHYSNPGPIQFAPELELKNKINMTIRTLHESKNDITEQIIQLCQGIQNDSMYAKNHHFLIAALSSLKASKQVLNS